MYTICTYEAITTAMHHIEGLAKKNITLPILENILIEAKEGFLFFSATNLELGVITHINAKIKKEGSIVVPPQFIQGFLNALSQQEHITLEVHDDVLKMSSGEFHTEIKGANAKEFPLIPQTPSQHFFSITLDVFKKMLQNVMHFATTNTIRPELTGVGVIKKEHDLICVATDSFRLGESKEQSAKVITQKEELFKEGVYIFPQKLSQYIQKITTEDQDVFCAIQDGHFFITYNNTQVTARLIDGTYPDYTQIIPQSSTTTAIVKKEALKEALKIMLVIIDQNTQEVQFTFKDQSIALTTKNQIQGRSDAKISCSLEGEEQEITLNPRFVLDGLQHIVQDDVYIGINNATSPILFYGADKKGVHKNFTYIVMPVKNT